MEHLSQNLPRVKASRISEIRKFGRQLLSDNNCGRNYITKEKMHNNPSEENTYFYVADLFEIPEINQKILGSKKLNLCELFGPGVGEVSQLEEYFTQITGLVKKNDSHVNSEKLIYLNADCFDSLDLAKNLKGKSFDFIVCSPIGLFGFVKIESTFSQYLSGIYTYVNTTYKSLKPGGVLITQAPIHDGKNSFLEYRHFAGTQYGSTINKFTSSYFRLLSKEMAKHDIQIIYGENLFSFALIKGPKAPSKLPKLNLDNFLRKLEF
jgi:hypothetical protein